MYVYLVLKERTSERATKWVPRSSASLLCNRSGGLIFVGQWTISRVFEDQEEKEEPHGRSLFLFSIIDKAKLNGFNRSLGTVGDVQLRDDMLHVVLDGGNGNRKVLGDLSVGLPLGKQPQHVELSRAKRFGKRLFMAFLGGPGNRLLCFAVGLVGQAPKQLHSKHLV